MERLSKRGVPQEAFIRLDLDLQRELQEHCSRIIHRMIVKSPQGTPTVTLSAEWPMGTELGGRVVHGHAKAGERPVCRLKEHDTYLLGEVMNLTVIDTGEPGKPESMLTYYNKPSKLNAEYARTNQKAGVPKDVLRSKFSQQPVKYNNAPVTYIDQGNVATGARASRAARW